MKIESVVVVTDDLELEEANEDNVASVDAEDEIVRDRGAVCGFTL